MSSEELVAPEPPVCEEQEPRFGWWITTEERVYTAQMPDAVWDVAVALIAPTASSSLGRVDEVIVDNERVGMSVRAVTHDMTHWHWFFRAALAYAWAVNGLQEPALASAAECEMCIDDAYDDTACPFCIDGASDDRPWLADFALPRLRPETLN